MSTDLSSTDRCRRALGDPDIDWLDVIAQANRFFVGPAIATTLRRLDAWADVPDDVRSYLSFLLDHNIQRNARIRRQCVSIGERLHAVGLEAVVLKGAAWLFDDDPDAGADRMMRDIDLLVARTDLQAAAAALVKAGYQDTSATFVEVGHFHHAPFVSGVEEASVELHRDLAHRADLLPSADMLGSARRIAPGLLLPTRAHRIVHNVIHAQIENGDWFSGVANLRDMLDLARLVARAADEVDWPSLAGSARARGLHGVVSGALHAAHALFGSPLPQPFAKHRAGRWHARRCLWQRQRPAVQKTLEAWGQLARAIAWDRDAYGLGITTRVSLAAQIKVNTERARRIGRMLWGARP